MTNVNYAAVATFSVLATYKQASRLPPTKPTGASLTRVQNLLTAALQLQAADMNTLALVTPPTGGKKYVLIQSDVAWAALNTVIRACQTIVAGQTGATVT